MRAGTSTLSITPALETGVPVWMGGFEALRPATAVQDDLAVRALVVEDRGRRLGIVTLDLIGLFAEDVGAIRVAAARAGLALDHLVVACTHTHAGPDTLGVWSPDGNGFRPAYLARVRERTVLALEQAAQDLVEVGLVVGQTTTPGLIRDTIAPEIIDEALVVLRLVAADEAPVATLVNWSNHAEVLGPDNQLLSADFPGALCADLEQDGGTAFFLPRAIGGLMTPIGVEVADPTTGSQAPEYSTRKMELVGGAVAQAARTALQEAGPGTSGGLQIKRREVRVPVTNVQLAEQLRSRISRTVEQDPELGPCLVSEVSHVALGPLDLVMVPGEMYPELLLGGVVPARDPADAWTYPPLLTMVDGPMFLVGLANDELGYVIPPSQWHYGRDPAEDLPLIYTPGREFAASLFEALSALLASSEKPARSKKNPSPNGDVMPGIHAG